MKLQKKNHLLFAKLLACPGKLENGIQVELWSIILLPFHQSSQKLQGTNMDLNEGVKILQSLRQYVDDLRVDSFDGFEAEGRKKSGTSEYKCDSERKSARSVK